MPTELEAKNYIRKTLQKSIDFYGKKHINVKKQRYIGKACFTQDYKMFGHLDSWNIALEYLNVLKPHDRVFNELILENAHVKPFFDVEWYSKDFPDYHPEDILNQILKCTKHIFENEFKFKLINEDFYIKTCHRETDKGQKYSFHIIISPERSLVCKDNTYCKYIANLLLNCVEFDKSIIDKSVYSKNRNLRLLGHSKGSCPDFPFLEYTKRQDIRHYIATFITKVYTILDIPEQEIEYPSASLTENESVEFQLQKEITNDTIVKVVEIAKTLCPSIYYDGRVVNNFIDLNYDHQTKKCPITNQLHDHIGLWAIVQNDQNVKDNIKIGCRSERCKNENGKTRVITLGSVNQLLTKQEEINLIEPVTVDENIISKIGFPFIRKQVKQKILGLSNIFDLLYSDRIKWVEEGNATYYWNGKLWQEDASLFVERLISCKFPELLEHYLRNQHNMNDNKFQEKKMDEPPQKEMSEEEEKETIKLIIQMQEGKINKNIMNMVRPLIYDKYFTKIKDNCSCELSVENGMVSLKTGIIRDAVPKDYITKSLDLEYIPEKYGKKNKNYIIFDEFIQDITRDIQGNLNPEIYTYLKWILGYSLQGVPKQKKFFIFWGPEGYNGKSILLNTISNVLENYSVTMDKSVVLQGPKKTAGSHSTELVRLENCRIGILSDTAEDCALDDGQIKQLTSITDSISVREIYGKQKEFKPTFVPIIATNFKIRINLKEMSLYDRCILVPFVCRFISNPDPNKPNERKANPDLASEFDDTEFKKSILCWLIDAGVFYSENENLNTPHSIIVAKQEYRKQMDIYQEFIGACCVVYNTERDSHLTRKTELIEQFVNYCIEQGVRVIKGKCEKEFNNILEQKKVDNVSYYIGIDLKNEE